MLLLTNGVEGADVEINVDCAKAKVFFDLDGVLLDWELRYHESTKYPLEEFRHLPKSIKNAIKESLFTYEFFRGMKPIPYGLDLFKRIVAEGYNVSICSATGHINKDAVKQGKIDCVRELLGQDIEILLVDKVGMKSQVMDPAYAVNVLIDDREDAIDAWRAAGGVGFLFKVPTL